MSLAGPSAARLVAALTTLASAGLGRWVLIGGLAVHVRLDRVHRATIDIDAVIDDSVPPDHVAALTSRPGVTAADATTFDVGGVTIEVLPAGPISVDDIDGVANLADRLFVAGLSWALDTAAAVQVAATGPPPSSTVVPVATVGALIAMKLHAIIDRRGPGQVKRASDALDLYQLLVNHGPAITHQLRSAPDQLRADTATIAQQILVDDARRTSGWMRQGPQPAVSADDIAVVGRRLLAGLAEG